MSGGVPAWMPSSVASAARRPGLRTEDLLSGEAWSALLHRLDEAGTTVRERAPEPFEQAAGHRHLLVLLALGIDEALRSSDPYDPYLGPGNVDAALKWGMDCPDAAYLGAPVRDDAVYRVEGRRGTVHYLGFQVMRGIETGANLVAPDPVAGDGGDPISLVLSSERRPGGEWLPLPGGATSLVVRQFFYDWEHETPADLRIECLEGPRRPSRTEPDPAAATAGQLAGLGDFVQESLDFWAGVQDQLLAEAPNRFRAPSARTDIGGAAENVTVWGSWSLEDGEALLVEVTPPPCRYWSVALGNQWWESLDYADHQSSLNGHQAVVDADGVFRAVIAATDPGVANWLDTAGFARGPMIFRWVDAQQEPPVPTTRLVRGSELDAHLPSGTARVDAARRAESLAARRRGVRRRFAR